MTPMRMTPPIVRVRNLFAEMHRDIGTLPLLVVLTGSPGTGKTHSGTRLFGFAIACAGLQRGKAPTAKWTTGFQATHQIKYAGSEFMRQWAFFAEPQFLFLDDVFTEKTTETDVHLVAELIETRKNALKRTIVTTNKTLIDFERLSARLAERMLEDAEIIAFSGPSMRLESA